MDINVISINTDEQIDFREDLEENTISFNVKEEAIIKLTKEGFIYI
jgi:hypothetical protein